MDVSLSYAFATIILLTSISLIGVIIVILANKRWGTFIDMSLAFAAGALLGESLFHLIPETFSEGIYAENSLSFILGIVASLGIETLVKFKHSKSHHHDMAINSLIADFIHNIMDGVAIAASFLASISGGLATTFAVVLHEIPQELADGTILVHAGWNKRRVIIANLIVSFSAVMGIVIVAISDELVSNVESILLPFAAGQFIYIAVADLVPELVRRKSGKVLWCVLLFIVGLLAMLALTTLE